jgi:hypothetical protein
VDDGAAAAGMVGGEMTAVQWSGRRCAFWVPLLRQCH